MGNTEKYFLGTELKIAINIECEGFSMDTDEWNCVVKKGSKAIVCNKQDNTAFDGENWYLLVDTSLLGVGKYVLVVNIDVPDNHFDDGKRHETYMQELLNIESV